MTRADAYPILWKELADWRDRPYHAILEFVGQQPPAKFVRIGEEEVVVSVRVTWADERRGTLRVEATADGPSCWRLERLEESVIVTPVRSVVK